MWSKAKARDLDEAALSAPGVPARLRRVCLKALAAAPAARYPNADALAAELERFLRPWPWWRTLLLWAAILAAAVAVGWAVGQWNRAAPPGPSGLDVMVYREKGEGYRPLAGSLPVKAGARVQVRVRVPAGTHATLFLLHGRGELRRLAEYPAADAVREEVYPGAGKVVPLTGSAGTGFFFVVGSRGGPVTDEQIRGLWAGAEVPALPTDSVVRVDSDRVRLEVGDRPRDVGAPEAVADPAEQVQQRLEEFRGRLRAAGVVYCDGLAFGHPGGEGGP